MPPGRGPYGSGCWPGGPAEPETVGPVSRGLHPSYPLRTEHLSLRPWRPDELDTYHRLRGDPGVVRYLYDAPVDRDGARVKLASLRTELSEPGQWINVAVEVVASGEIAGDAGIGWVSDVHRQADIGYSFLPEHRGHGYATEAAAAMVDLAFTGLAAHRVCGRLDARNTASARVLERLGMRHEAHFVQNEWVKGEWADEAVYAVLADEWAGSGARP
jgi:RimJ/RimL family protein N-acetyltransferase